MPALVDRVVRTIFRREALPKRVLWWFVAEGTGEWALLLRRELAAALGGDEACARALSEIAAPMFRRRYGVLRASRPSMTAPNDRAVALAMSALYRVASNADAAFLFGALGGAATTFRDHAEAEQIIESLDADARWREVSCHLGELLVALTHALPARMPRAHAALGDLCFAAGVRFGKKMKKAWSLGDSPAEALEVLRMSEYVFRVNPEHWSETTDDARTGMLEGSACPWYTAPGWSGAHCGIFGQFQSGITSVYGLRYHLTTTIPKHGGRTCRIDVKPLAASTVTLRRKPAHEVQA